VSTILELISAVIDLFRGNFGAAIQKVITAGLGVILGGGGVKALSGGVSGLVEREIGLKMIQKLGSMIYVIRDSETMVVFTKNFFTADMRDAWNGALNGIFSGLADLQGALVDKDTYGPNADEVTPNFWGT
jgi:hypothetical protein